MNGYYPVVSCPRNAFEWEASSQRLNCTNAHMYHCNQYKAIQLYEFCYGNDVFEVKKGKYCKLFKSKCAIHIIIGLNIMFNWLFCDFHYSIMLYICFQPSFQRLVSQMLNYFDLFS